MACVILDLVVKNYINTKTTERHDIEKPYLNEVTDTTLKNLLMQMLAYDPAKRPSIEEIFLHPFFDRYPDVWLELAKDDAARQTMQKALPPGESFLQETKIEELQKIYAKNIALRMSKYTDSRLCTEST